MNKYIFIYDGGCELCTAFQDWVIEKAGEEQMETVAFGDPRIPELLHRLSESEIQRSAHLVTPDGTALSGHKAILLVLSFTWWGQILVPILSLPFFDPLVNLIYIYISKHRHRIKVSRSVQD